MIIFILIILSILGPILVFVGLSSLVVSIRRHPYLLRIKGTIHSVEEKYDMVDKKVTFYPTIVYTAPQGNQVRFRSMGSTHDARQVSGIHSSPWRDGQRIDVFHDPSGELDPCIASLWSLYGGGVGFLIFGILLLMGVVIKWNQLGV